MTQEKFPDLRIDASQAIQFFETLFDTGEGIACTELRAIHPDKKLGLPIVTGWGSIETLGDCAGLLDLNKQGYGIYAVINRLDEEKTKAHHSNFKGAEDSFVTDITAVFVELDEENEPGHNLLKLQSCALEPTLIIQSSTTGKLHGYWRLKDCPVDKFRPLQIQLISFFEGDPTCKNESRIMRVPGFFHTKNEPIMTRILEASGLEYSFDQFCEAFGFDPDYQLYQEAPEPPEGYEAPEDIAVRIIKAADKHIQGIGESGRHKTLIWAALSCLENRLERSDALEVMNTVTNKLPSRNGEPVPLSEAHDVLDWVYSKANPGTPWQTREVKTMPMGLANKPKEEPQTNFDTAGVDIALYRSGYALEKETKRKGQVEISYTQLTNWIFEPMLQLVFPDGSMGERGTLTVNGKVTHMLDLPANAWNSRKEILNSIGKFGCVCFTNSSSDIAKIRQFILLKFPECPVARGVKSYGLHEVSDGWLLLYSDETVHDSNTPPVFYAGVPTETNFYKFQAPKMDAKGLELAKDAIKDMKALMTLSAALGVMGYAAAAPYAPRLWQEFDGNKIYFAYVEGERETGKSTFIELCLRFSTGYSHRQQMAGKISPYQYDLTVSNANNLLCFLDEYKRGESEHIDTLIRAHHDNETKTRGTGVAGRQDEYIRNAPMIINGEGFSEDPATRSRGVIVYPLRKDRGDHALFHKVRTAPLEAYAAVLHGEARTMPQDLLLERLKAAKTLAKRAAHENASPRLLNGLGVVAFGLLTLQEHIDKFAFDEASISFALNEIAQNTLQGGVESKANLEIWLEELAYALSTVQKHQLDNFVMPSNQANSLIIRLTPCIALTNSILKGKQSIKNPGMLQRLANDSEFFVKGNNHEAITGVRCRGIRVKLNELPERVDAGLLIKFNEDMRRGYTNAF